MKNECPLDTPLGGAGEIRESPMLSRKVSHFAKAIWITGRLLTRYRSRKRIKVPAHRSSTAGHSRNGVRDILHVHMVGAGHSLEAFQVNESKGGAIVPAGQCGQLNAT